MISFINAVYMLLVMRMSELICPDVEVMEQLQKMLISFLPSPGLQGIALVLGVERSVKHFKYLSKS